MNKWQETVKRVAKQHPGKSLREILPIAKLEYKKMGHSSSAPTKKHKKHHKKSHSHKRKGSRKGRKGRKGSRRMRGGGEVADTTEPVSYNADELDNYSPYGGVQSEIVSENVSGVEVKEAMTGGSHCGTHGRRRRRRRPTRRRGPKRRRMRGGGCAGENKPCPQGE